MSEYIIDFNNTIKYLNYKDNFKYFLLIFILINILIDVENIQHIKNIFKYLFYIVLTFILLRYFGDYTGANYNTRQRELDDIHFIIKRQYQMTDIEDNIEPRYNPVIYWSKFSDFINNHIELGGSLDEILSYKTINRDNVYKIIYLTYTLILMKLENNSFYKLDELSKKTDFYEIYEKIKDYGKGIQLNLNCDYDVQIYLRKLQTFLTNLKRVIF